MCVDGLALEAPDLKERSWARRGRGRRELKWSRALGAGGRDVRGDGPREDRLRGGGGGAHSGGRREADKRRTTDVRREPVTSSVASFGRPSTTSSSNAQVAHTRAQRLHVGQPAKARLRSSRLIHGTVSSNICSPGPNATMIQPHLHSGPRGCRHT